MTKYLGIDIGGTFVKYALLSPAGEISARAEYPVAFDGYQTPILETVLRTSEAYLQKNCGGTGGLLGIGVSATGQIDCRSGIVAGTGGNIANWEGSRIKEQLTEKYKLPVTVINDANSVALGELWLGRAKGCRHVVVVTIGTGLGGGIIVDGNILLGRHGFGGELGHLIIRQHGQPCSCRNSGCYEQFASVTALLKKMKQHYPQIKPEALNGRYFFSLVQAGDQLALQILDEWTTDIAAGLIGLVHVFNPELVLIGGGVSSQKQHFVSVISEKVKHGVMPNFNRDLRVEAAALGNDAGLAGAVYYLLSGN